MDHLWSPWRLAYVTGAKSQTGCPFCQAAEAQADTAEATGPGSLVVHRGATCYVILNLYPYNNGHLMVVPYRHVATLGGLRPEELQEIASLTQLVEAALTEAYDPQGINIGINLGTPAGAGILEHLHVHAVPRWTGDANFMTAIAETRVLPEDLGSTARRLRPIFERLTA
jgi:ATP adenylyltransferase